MKLTIEKGMIVKIEQCLELDSSIKLGDELIVPVSVFEVVSVANDYQMHKTTIEAKLK